LGRIRLEPVKPDIGRPYFRAVSTLQPLALLEMDASSAGSEEGSSPLRWWTRQERCRTAGEQPFQIALLDTEPAALYQRVAKEASHLRQLGLSIATIASHLRVDQETAAKAIQWYGNRH
jgi:hypothetical protein